MAGGHVNYSVDGGPVQKVVGPLANVSVSGDGEHTLSYSATDLAGNSSKSEELSLRIDSSAPPRPEVAQPAGWLRVGTYALDASVASAPVSGIAGYSFTTDGSEPDANVDITSGRIGLDDLADGPTIVKVRTVSGSGLASERSTSVALRVDRAMPEARLSGAPESDRWTAGPVKLAISASDELSGPEEVVYRIDDRDEVRTPGDSASLSVAEDGPHTVSYYAVDAAGNRSADQAVHFRIDSDAPGRAAVNAPAGWFSPA